MSSPPPLPPSESIASSRDRVGIDSFDLGVLLVHGLGEQQRSDTLTEAGDRIFEWLRQRVETPGPEQGDVDVLDVVARQASGDAIPAAHAVVRITPPEGMGTVAHWVVAEAWWADVFRPATYNEMRGWALSVGPWVFATQVAGIRRRLEIGEDVPLWLRLVLIPVTLVVGFAMIVGAAIVGFAITVLAAAIFLFTVINLPFVSDAARHFQRTLANGFGDAYVLTRSPVRFGAMASSVRANIQNLREHCQSVVVIAHSQGTGVAWFALLHELLDTRPASEGPAVNALAFAAGAEPGSEGAEIPGTSPGDRARAPIGLFITYGQAVRKLTFALHLAKGGQTLRQKWLALGSAGFVGLAVLALVVTGEPRLPLAIAGLAVVAELMLMRSAGATWKSSGEHIQSDWLAVHATQPNIEWLDLWASADPASVGPLDVVGQRIDSYKIRNLASTLADHTVYWQNTTEFLAIVGAKLFSLGGPRIYAADLYDPRIRVAAMRRHARVMALMTMRMLVFGAILAGIVFALLTPSFGEGLLTFVDGLDLPFVDGFFAKPPVWAAYVAGVVPILVAGVVVWLAVQGFWNSLTAADDATYFGGGRRPLWSARWYGLGALVVLVAVVATVLLNLAYGPDLAAAYVIGAIFFALLGLAVLSGGGFTFAGTEESEPTEQALDRLHVPRPLGWTIVGVPAVILIALPLIAGIFVAAQLGAVVLAIEAVALSIVLAIEGFREYGVFRRHFEERSKALAHPPDRG